MPIWKKTFNTEKFCQNAPLGGAARSLGIELSEVGDDFIIGRMPVDERTTQPFGLLNGGASCLLAETLGSIGANLCIEEENSFAVGGSLHASHLRPADKGFVTGTARPKHLGRKSHVWEIDIKNDEQKTICLVVFHASVVQGK